MPTYGPSDALLHHDAGTIAKPYFCFGDIKRANFSRVLDHSGYKGKYGPSSKGGGQLLHSSIVTKKQTTPNGITQISLSAKSSGSSLVVKKASPSTRSSCGIVSFAREAFKSLFAAKMWASAALPA